MGLISECRFCAKLCPGDDLPPEVRSPFDQVLEVGPDAIVVPTLGMLTPGYLLVVSEEHERSFSHWTASALHSLEAYLRELTRRLAPLFGEYLIFEHGPADSPILGSGACIDHAHFHLIPTANDLAAHVMAAFRWTPLADLSELRKHRGKPYALASLRGSHHVVVVDDLPTQWIRRLLAERLGTPGRWDWKRHSGLAELQTTIDRLRRQRIITQPPAWAQRDND